MEEERFNNLSSGGIDDLGRGPSARLYPERLGWPPFPQRRSRGRLLCPAANALVAPDPPTSLSVSLHRERNPQVLAQRELTTQKKYHSARYEAAGLQVLFRAVRRPRDEAGQGPHQEQRGDDRVRGDVDVLGHLRLHMVHSRIDP